MVYCWLMILKYKLKFQGGFVKMKKIEQYRNFLKANDWQKWEQLERDQAKDVPRPAKQKEYSTDDQLIDLIPYKDINLGDKPIKEIIAKRRSRRKYTDEYLSKEELSYLLWATQGVKENNNFRTVPSGGARHPFETYLYIKRVEGIEPGIYRYLPMEHKLLVVYLDNNLDEKMNAASSNQKFVIKSAVVFIWTAIPYRTEWRYSILSHKIIAQDSGHLCQNLYLASESIGAGTCGIGAYNQEKMDEIVRVDGEEEFAIYVAPVGMIEN
jgi:SagB-type dehydrogenase family enzyme